MLHIPPTNYHLLAAKQEPQQKACLLPKSIADIFWGKSPENVPVGSTRKEKEKIERAIGVGRRTREEIVQSNQTSNDGPRF